MEVALVYDRVNKWGGAERVLLALHEIFPNAPLYTSVYSPKNASWAKVFPRIITSSFNKIPFLQNKHEYLSIFMPTIFENFKFDEYDLVISVTSEAAKGIITGGKTKHICYCLTPTRYLWSHYITYFKGSTFKVVARPFISYLRRWDKTAAQRPDIIIAISNEVKKRIKKYYNRGSKVIFPPVTMTSKINTTILYSIVDNKIGREGGEFYLIVSRLVPYKMVDLAIEAFNKLKLPLYIIGIGSEDKKLKKMAKPNIKFLGELSDEKLAYYYKYARALIFPQEEDFGLVAIEAQSFGTPVIAFKKGGALDTVIEDKTGIFFDKQEKNSLVEAVKKFTSKKFDKNVIIENTKRFSQKRFKEEFLKVIKNSI